MNISLTQLLAHACAGSCTCASARASLRGVESTLPPVSSSGPSTLGCTSISRSPHCPLSAPYLSLEPGAERSPGSCRRPRTHRARPGGRGLSRQQLEHRAEAGPARRGPGRPWERERAAGPPGGRPRSGGDAPDRGGTDITTPHREIPRSAQARALRPTGGGCSARPTPASLGRRRAPHLCGPPFFPAKKLCGVVAIRDTNCPRTLLQGWGWWGAGSWEGDFL